MITYRTWAPPKFGGRWVPDKHRGSRQPSLEFSAV